MLILNGLGLGKRIGYRTVRTLISRAQEGAPYEGEERGSAVRGTRGLLLFRTSTMAAAHIVSYPETASVCT